MLPELLRDLGAFSAIWEHLHPAHIRREAARVFPMIIGALETEVRPWSCRP